MADNQDEMLAKYLEAKTNAPQAPANQWGQPQQRQQNYRQQRGNQRGGSQWNQGQQRGGGGGGQDGEEEVPMLIRNFLEDFSTSVTDRRVSALDDMYAKEYPRLCDQLIRNKIGKNQKWPTLAEAVTFLGDDQNVRLLYKELYYRHIFARLDKQVTGEDRVDAYENYQSIFDRLDKELLNPNDDKSLLSALPLSWLWDILDEFIYQYMQFMQFKAKAISKKAKSNQQPPTGDGRQQHQVEQDYQIVKENPALFDPGEVFYTLKRLITKTQVEGFLKVHKGLEQNVPEDMLPNEQQRFLGYFAYIQQMRYQILLGEYDVALKTVERLDFGFENALYYKSPAAHITLSYFVAFSLFMQKRYSDCMTVISKCLHFVVKLQRFPPLSSLYEAQQRGQERMMRLLVLCVTFAPDNFHAQVEDQIVQFALDKYAEDIKILKTWGLKDDQDPSPNANPEQPVNKPFAAKMVEWFNAVAVKYVTILDANCVESGNINPMEGHNRQWERFWTAMDEQKTVPMIRNFLSMYTKISLTKLTKLCKFPTEEITLKKLDQVARAQNQLVMQETVNAAGKTTLTILPGVPQKCTNLDFTYDEQTREISVKLLSKPKNYAQIYVKEIHHLAKIMKDVEDIAVVN